MGLGKSSPASDITEPEPNGGTAGVVAVLAMRFGYDSRESPDSKEETWSNLGLRMELSA